MPHWTHKLQSRKSTQINLRRFNKIWKWYLESNISKHFELKLIGLNLLRNRSFVCYSWSSQPSQGVGSWYFRAQSNETFADWDSLWNQESRKIPRIKSRTWNRWYPFILECIIIERIKNINTRFGGRSSEHHRREESTRRRLWSLWSIVDRISTLMISFWNDWRWKC